MLLCMACLCSATWAWFTAGVECNGNTVSSANYDIDLTVNGAPIADKTVELATGEHTVLLQKQTNPDSATCGYCRIIIGGKTYFTRPIKTDDNNTAEKEDVLTVVIEVKTPSAHVTFDPWWGTYAGDDVISDGERIIVE